MRWRWLELALAGLLLANAVFLATRLGSEFVPRLQEGTIVINTVRLPGVSVDESVRYGTQIEKLLLAEFPDEIDHVWTRTGTAEVATDPMGLEVSDVFVTLTPRDKWKRGDTQAELVEAMKEELSVLPGTKMSFTQPIEMRVNEMVAGVRGDLGVKLFGDDLDVLRQKAAEIERIIREIPGAEDVSTEQLTGQPMLQIEVDTAATARFGISTASVLEVVKALGTYEVGIFQEGERRFPIPIRIDDAYRADEAAIGRILVTSASGDRIPLSRLATIQITEGMSSVNREWGKRRIVVQSNIRGRDIAGFVEDVKRAIETEVELPDGSYVRYGGQFEHLERARLRLAIVVPMALALILLLLYLTYRRVLDALCVFTAVPLATVGGVVALWIRGLPFSISAAVGFIALFGVAVLNGLVMVSAVRQLVSRGAKLIDAIPLAAEQRLRPVMMTALVASLGFLPMALNTGIGAEVQRPLATVVIGGIVSATLLTLFVLPVLYSFIGAKPCRPKPAATSLRSQRRKWRPEASMMRPLRFGVLLVVALAAACRPSQDGSQAPPANDRVRRAAALLDYVAADYGDAVVNGKIASDTEYREQVDFLRSARELVAKLPPAQAEPVLERIDVAVGLVDEKAQAERVLAACRAARAELLDRTGVTLGPSASVSLARGAELFAASCAACHGTTGGGDGPAARGLNPAPRSFLDPQVTTGLSPVRAYSAITDGVAGTAMPSFAALGERDRWDLAFFVSALRHDDAAAERGRAAIARGAARSLSIAQLANATDGELVAGLDEGSDDVLAFYRRVLPAQSDMAALAVTRRGVTAAKRAYASGDAGRARQELDAAYLDGFEQLEGLLRVDSGDLVIDIEERFLALRELTRSGASTSEFGASADRLLVRLDAVESRVAGGASGQAAFVAALVVIVREGVESVLLLMLLFGLVARAGQEGDRRAVHAGWVAAVAVGVVTWVASESVVRLGGGNRELVEGVVALFAVVVLVYAGHIVLARMDAERRIAALKRRFAAIPLSRRRVVLFGMAFVAVFREVFEVVLFLRAIQLSAGDADAAIALGVVTGSILCVALVLAFRLLRGRIRPGTVLNGAGALLCALALVLAGKGVRSLQEAGVLAVRAIDVPRVDLLGLYPTIETVAAQLLVAAAITLVAALGRRPREVRP
ncbi:MAG: efflux RND transporter permease subunit [Kofleriaceae bacterium]